MGGHVFTATETNSKEKWQQAWEVLSGHPLQSWQWGQLKTQTGPWDAHRIIITDDSGKTVGGAQILVRSLPWPFTAMCYIPRGPLAAPGTHLADIADVCAAWCKKNTRAVSLKIDPAVTKADLGKNLSASWSNAPTVLIAKTATIPLTGSQDEIMHSIHSKKARQYIRKATREGVVCRPARREDLPDILNLYHHTANNDGFTLHSDEFYNQAWSVLDGINQVFVAEAEGKIQAFLWNATSDDTAFELWGAVSDQGKKLRANYALKWTAICAARDRGTRLYDLNGLLNDGISDFKLLWVSEPTWWIGTFDHPLKPLAGLWKTAMRLHSKWNQRNDAQKNTSSD